MESDSSFLHAMGVPENTTQIVQAWTTCSLPKRSLLSCENQHPLWLLLGSLLKKHMRSCHPHAPQGAAATSGLCVWLSPHTTEGTPQTPCREGRQTECDPHQAECSTAASCQIQWRGKRCQIYLGSASCLSFMAWTNQGTIPGIIPQHPFLAVGLTLASGLLNIWLHLGVSWKGSCGF